MLRSIAASLGALLLASTLSCGSSGGSGPGAAADIDAGGDAYVSDSGGGADDVGDPLEGGGDDGSMTDAAGTSDTGAAMDGGETGDGNATGDSGDAGVTGDAGDAGDSGVTGDAGDSGVTSDAGGDATDGGDSGAVDANPPASVIVTPTSGLTTTETGGTATFTVQLGSAPTDTVTIGISSSNVTHGTVSPAVLTFTAGATGNWATPQTVTITGVNDHTVTGDLSYSIVTAPAVSTDPDYQGLNPPDVSVTSIDSSVAAIVVSRTSGLVTTEGGGIDSFTLKLNTMPTASVTIGLSSNNVTDGTVSPTSVVFSTTNWSVAQTVTVTGVETNTAADGSHAYQVVTAPAVSADALYNALNAADISVTNEDDDIKVYAGKLGQPGTLVGFCSTPSCAMAGSSPTFPLKLKGSVNFFLANAGDTHAVASGETVAPSWFPASGPLSATTPVTVTPTTAGAHPFYCNVHGSSESGTIMVSP
jgi:hypothetical protein